MDRLMRLVCVLCLAAPVGLWATSAGAASGTTCKSFSATETTTPGLPVITSKTKVNATVKLVGKLAGCSGGGVTGASIAETYKYDGNCATFVTGKGGVTTPAKPTATFTWSNHKTSTATSTVTLLSKPGVTPAKLKLVTTITGGQFAGTSSTGTVTLTGPKGACVTSPGTKATLTGGTATFK